MCTGYFTFISYENVVYDFPDRSVQCLYVNLLQEDGSVVRKKVKKSYAASAPSFSFGDCVLVSMQIVSDKLVVVQLGLYENK